MVEGEELRQIYGHQSIVHHLKPSNIRRRRSVFVHSSHLSTRPVVGSSAVVYCALGYMQLNSSKP